MTTDHRTIMIRAWAIFRETYGYPAVPFRSIGRACFTWALRRAWHEAREAARVAAIPAETRGARIAALTGERELLTYADSWRWAEARRAQIDGEIRRLEWAA